MFELGTEEYLRHGIKMTPKQKDPRKLSKEMRKKESDGKPDKQGMYGQDESVDVYEKQTPGQNKKGKPTYKSFQKIYKASKKNSVPKKTSVKKEGMSYSEYKVISESATMELIAGAGALGKLALGGLLGAGLLGTLGFLAGRALFKKTKGAYKSIVSSLRSDSQNKAASIQETIKKFNPSEKGQVTKTARKNASNKANEYYTKYYGVKRVQAISNNMDAIIAEGVDNYIGKQVQQKTQLGKQLSQQAARTPKLQTAAESVSYDGTLLSEKKKLSKEQEAQLKAESAKIDLNPKEALIFFQKEYPKTKEFRAAIKKATKEFPLSDFKSLIDSSQSQIQEETYIDLLISEKIEESKSLLLTERRRGKKKRGISSKKRKASNVKTIKQEMEQEVKNKPTEDGDAEGNEVKEIPTDTQALSQVLKTEGDYYTNMYQARVISVLQGFPTMKLNKVGEALTQKMEESQRNFILEEAGKLKTGYDSETLGKILNTNVFLLTDEQIGEVFAALYGSIDNAKEKYKEDFARFSQCMQGGTCSFDPGDAKEEGKTKSKEDQEKRAKKILGEMREVQKKVQEVIDDETLPEDEKRKKINDLLKEQNDLKKLLELSRQMQALEKEEDKEGWLKNLVGDDTFSHLRGTAVENAVRKLVSAIPYVGGTMAELLVPIFSQQTMK